MKVNVVSAVGGLVGLAAVAGAVVALEPVVSAVVTALWTVAVLKALVVGGVGVGFAVGAVNTKDVVSVVLGLFGVAAVVLAVGVLVPVVSAVVTAVVTLAVLLAVVVGGLGVFLVVDAYKKLR
jgi:hypothetical protein